eukprot:TRINITY_DN2863_c0_g1_i3.p1 TRINITY_DN2863_c0_g1~~TRINITY_DN2863_c0_g1_i3.p1  ORF type:complete len:474 (-),score=151.30 TRINITY_DN2863_c0_g1_i3:340-1761(-)
MEAGGSGWQEGAQAALVHVRRWKLLIPLVLFALLSTTWLTAMAVMGYTTRSSSVEHRLLGRCAFSRDDVPEQPWEAALDNTGEAYSAETVLLEFLEAEREARLWADVLYRASLRTDPLSARELQELRACQQHPDFFHMYESPRCTELWVRLTRTAAVGSISNVLAVLTRAETALGMAADKTSQNGGFQMHFEEGAGTQRGYFKVCSGTKNSESHEKFAREIVAFHLDRILGFFRKPPIVGRVVDSSLLWSSWWNAWLPSYEVPVTLHAWVEGLVTRYPALELYDFLTFEGHIQENAKILSYAADISDTLVFDFLVDDHDRKAEKNWVEFTKDGRLTHWDSGLAFNHGPVGDGFCLDILCGPNVWRRTRMGLTGRAQCDRICRFRTSTVERLRNIHDATDEHVKLSYRLKQALSESVLFPAFHYGVYYSDRREVELVRFESDEFFAGLDERLGRILGHIDGCVRAYGDAALIDV